MKTLALGVLCLKYLFSASPDQKNTCEQSLKAFFSRPKAEVTLILLWVPDTVNKDTEPKDPFPSPRKIMAEPDYIDDDNPELIRPQKLINPVKSSRNHQDLHRELLMNQKRGLAPQNKPELQKVMEKRKRDQVIKQQKEEEAQKKKSDLEIELLKRQQKLEQLELEKQKIQEEQENAPEFVKVKGNLRRTVQEATEAPDS
uniref:Family with sequence similarity 107 member B n=1 Tax=Zosterops lateralis melanops TaxID=1220523 RepID=A0A8D2P4M2_ZOSLA